MQAISLGEYKNSTEQDWELKEISKPVPADGEVLVRLCAASINPVDVYVVGGHLASAGWAQPTPFTPGYDLAGVVEKVGTSVDQFMEGDEVYGVNWALDVGQAQGKHDDESALVGGAFAQFIRIPACKLSKKPKDVSFQSAAAVALVGTTALQGLRNIDALKPQKKVLVLGGASSVGYTAIQIAKANGAEVVATSSARTMEYVKKAGADQIINYTEEKWEENASLLGFDAVFDTVGEKDGFLRAKRILKDDGSFVSIANFDAGFDPSAHAPLKYAAWYCLKNNVFDQDYLMALMLEGKLQLPVEECFPFSMDGIQQAFAKQAGGKSMGKNIILF